MRFFLFFLCLRSLFCGLIRTFACMKDKKTKVVFIVNPISGTRSKDGLKGLVEETLDSRQFDWTVVKTEYAGHAAEIAASEAANGTDICVAVGGDGTVNEVARSLVNTPTALAIIPCGSGNGLARHLRLPMNMKGALTIINTARIESFDYGTVGGHPFFCTCGMGFDAFISLKFAQAGKRGLSTYVENVLREGLRYKPDVYTIEDETGIHCHRAFLIACANAAQYGNNAYIAPGASMQDGLLDVIIMEPFSAIEAPAIGIDLFAKTLSSNSHIKTFQARRLHIHRSREGAVHYDGDPTTMGTDIDVEIHPKALRAVVNPAAIEDPAHPTKMINAISSFFHKII